MKRAKKAVPLLAVLFLAMPSSGERFGHVAEAQTIASVLAAQIRSQGFACDDPQKATGCEAVKAGLRCLGSDVQECHLQNGRYPDLAAKVEKLK
jgi:hypothetical protein